MANYHILVTISANTINEGTKLYLDGDRKDLLRVNNSFVFEDQNIPLDNIFSYNVTVDTDIPYQGWSMVIQINTKSLDPITGITDKNCDASKSGALNLPIPNPNPL